jgi:non-ribosomal peptide synthetase component F
MKPFGLAASETRTRREAEDQRFAEWTKTDVEQSIPTRFEQQVMQYGTRQAVCGERGILTYDELNRLANRIARAILADLPVQ